MLHIGYHESSSGGYMAMGKEALSVNADTFAFFTRKLFARETKCFTMLALFCIIVWYNCIIMS